MQITAQRHSPTIETINDYELEFQHYHTSLENPQSRQKIDELQQQNMDFQNLVAKQEEYMNKLIGKVKQIEDDNVRVKTDNQKLIEIVENLQGQLKSTENQDSTNVKNLQQEKTQLQQKLEAISQELEKTRLDRDNSKDQNKKLVELFNKLEKKLNDKCIREEQLEEECLQLREQMQLMGTQVEKIEDSVEKKVREKEKQIKQLKMQVEMLEREKRMREDMEDLGDEDNDHDQQSDDKIVNKNRLNKDIDDNSEEEDGEDVDREELESILEKARKKMQMNIESDDDEEEEVENLQKYSNQKKQNQTLNNSKEQIQMQNKVQKKQY
eukprot:403361833